MLSEVCIAEATACKKHGSVPGSGTRSTCALTNNCTEKRVPSVEAVTAYEREFLFGARKPLSFGMRRSYSQSEAPWETATFLFIFISSSLISTNLTIR